MYASVVAGTRDAMSVINEANSLYFYSRSLVTMCQPGSIDHILLESHGIPDFDRPVVGTGDEEVVVGCDDDPIYWPLVLSKVRNERSFGMPVLERVRSVVVESEWLASRG